ncbi:MAG: sigma-70 family RNA polymerase sigma factor [Clostridia bacterium]|nr:sigma-70 family RNA polymerase sigma factor [Clostridia bacterium]
MLEAEILEKINLAQKNEEEAMEELLRVFKPKVTAISRGYFLVGADADDLIQEGMIGLYKSIMVYKPNKNHNFGAFASLCIHRQMQNAVKNANRKKNSPLNSYLPIMYYDGSSSNDDEELLKLVVVDDDSNVEQNFIDAEMNAVMLSKVKDVLSEEQFKLLKMFLNGDSYIVMSEKVSMSVKQVDNSIQAIKKKLRSIKGDLQ